MIIDEKDVRYNFFENISTINNNLFVKVINKFILKLENTHIVYYYSEENIFIFNKENLDLFSIILSKNKNNKIKTILKSADLKIKGFSLKINENYMFISKSKFIINLDLNFKVKLWCDISKKNLELIINDTYSILNYINTIKRWVLSTNKFLISYFNEIFILYLEVLSEESSIYLNDIVNDIKLGYLQIPGYITDLSVYKNKHMYLQNKFPKFPITKKYNKYPLFLSYMVLKNRKYFLESDIVKFLDFITNNRLNEYSFIDVVFEFYNLNINNMNKHTLYDYLEMVIELNGKVKLNLNIKSLNKLKRTHDETVLVYLKKKFKKENKVLIPENSKFKNLKLPSNFELIKTQSRLWEEGFLQKNCVYSRLNKIMNNKCVIYSLEYEDKRYTIEFIKRKDNYYISEIKGKNNLDVDYKIIEYINYYIK